LSSLRFYLQKCFLLKSQLWKSWTFFQKTSFVIYFACWAHASRRGFAQRISFFDSKTLFEIFCATSAAR
jgi:hypothetical protein